MSTGAGATPGGSDVGAGGGVDGSGVGTVGNGGSDGSGGKAGGPSGLGAGFADAAGSGGCEADGSVAAGGEVPPLPLGQVDSGTWGALGSGAEAELTGGALGAAGAGKQPWPPMHPPAAGSTQLPIGPTAAP